MRGEIRLVVDRLCREVWIPVVEDHRERSQFAGSLFGAVAPFMIDRYTPDRRDGKPDTPLMLRVADSESDYDTAIEELRSIEPEDFASEADAVQAVAAVKELLDEYESDDDADAYRRRLVEFIDRYSLRYYVGPTCDLSVTLPGIASSTFHEFRKICYLSTSLASQLDEFEHALAEAVADPVPMRIRTAISKLFILMEGVASVHPDTKQVSQKTFGQLCQAIPQWPHNALRDAADSLYTFACDYPGIRHAGTPTRQRRELDARDLSAMSVILFGFTNYLTIDIPDAAGLTLQRRVRQEAETLTTSGRSW